MTHIRNIGTMRLYVLFFHVTFSILFCLCDFCSDTRLIVFWITTQFHGYDI